ncbi:MAG: phage baseplate assembly protein V [Pseudomonadota bacterium]
MRREAAEQGRKAAAIVRIGRVVEADYAAARVKLEIGDLVTGWMPWATARAGGDVAWWAPEIGEQMLALATDGGTDIAVAIGAIYQSDFPAPAASPEIHRIEYADGAVIEYDRGNHALKALLPAGATVRLDAPGGVTINGDVTVNGTVTASDDVVADTISLRTHTHGGVVPGGGSTGVPNA